MKKIILVIAALVIVGGGLFLGFGSAKADSPSAPLASPPPGYFTVIVNIDASVDRECLENCIDQVVFWRSDGSPQYQAFVYNTWQYTFYSRAPFTGTLWAAVTTLQNCGCTLTITPGTEYGTWEEYGYVYLTVSID